MRATNTKPTSEYARILSINNPEVTEIKDSLTFPVKKLNLNFNGDHRDPVTRDLINKMPKTWVFLGNNKIVSLENLKSWDNIRLCV